jgi:hypothetical protein
MCVTCETLLRDGLFVMISRCKGCRDLICRHHAAHGRLRLCMACAPLRKKAKRRRKR